MASPGVAEDSSICQADWAKPLGFILDPLLSLLYHSQLLWKSQLKFLQNQNNVYPKVGWVSDGGVKV